MASAPQSGLYVLEYAKNSIASGDPTGALIYLAPNGDRSTIASDGLINPTGLAVGSNGTIYISNNGNSKNNGEIISISVPEPNANSTLDLSALGALGLLLLRERRRSKSKSFVLHK